EKGGGVARERGGRAERQAAGAGAGVEVLDQLGAGGTAVALPQLHAGDAVVGEEESGAVQGGKAGGTGAEPGGGVDILDQARRQQRPILEHFQPQTEGALPRRAVRAGRRRGPPAN